MKEHAVKLCLVIQCYHIFMMRISVVGRRVQKSSSRVRLSEEALVKAIQPLTKLQEETNESLKLMNARLNSLSNRISEQQQGGLSSWSLVVLIVAFLIQLFVQWLFRWKTERLCWSNLTSHWNPLRADKRLYLCIKPAFFCWLLFWDLVQ